ncbi:4a-hydroxytetrahydrobiopterin dehydratase [Moraxella sp. Tifton1]|uniref:4a-hydroxytetrahydrobiopterin dehydratase n=1 Tax=Moraxella oculi TaxID=2940516 RepID=A0ABW8UAQ1_9GAMM|nr:4a-hydroxytetrahydrobiopterin dehydratase [Moraxella sp. Tifton1]MCL1624331.1 4a-hydroxytetrahydrobiopterin dehydratase [Moraxella sp. Tifton1]
MSSMTSDQVALQLDGLPAWQLDGSSLVRTYEFADFASVVAFIVKMSFHAQELEHYPHWESYYTTLKVSIGNADQGTLHNRDVQLAKRLETSFNAQKM